MSNVSRKIGRNVKVTFDRKAWDGLLDVQKFIESRDPHVNLGWFDGPSGDHGDGLTNTQLAAVHEFGVEEKGIPARKPLATTIERITPEIKKRMEAIYPVLLQAKTKQAASTLIKEQFGRLGLWAEAEVKKTIMTGPHLPPPLADATVARKGSDRPLVDTGRLVGGLTHVYTEGDDK